MFLKNYTSNVPVSETIHHIEKVLIRCGVAGIMKEYVGMKGEVGAITFQIETPGGKTTIRLPVDRDKALNALWLDYADGDEIATDGNAIRYNARKRKTKADFVDQANRTAWKIIQDWIEVQMSMIQLKQADTLQVFLPYIYNGKRTFYESLKESNFRGVLPEKAGDDS